MLYLTGSIPETDTNQAALRALGVGVMAQPRSYAPATVNGWTWAADNGCFADNWDADHWCDWLDRMRTVPGCLWAVVPDVVGDHQATRERLHEWGPIVADLGYRRAFVAQNGATIGSVPWGEFDCLFVGGDTTWKLGHQAETIVRHANRLGLWTHMGRVNSERRMRIAETWGVDSCDGTFLAFGPDTNIPRLARMLRSVNDRPSLLGQL